MAHRVRITPEAEPDLRAIGDYIRAQHAPDAARKFVRSLRRRIALLKTFPEGYGSAPEAQAAGAVRRWIVLQGRTVFHQIIQDPDY